MDLDFDPEVISYKDLLDMFWKNHDPTVQCTRQYMSAIFYHDEEQKRLAEESMEKAAKDKSKKITTKIMPAEKFYVAEGYHQKYLLQQHPWLLQALDIDPEDELIESHVAARLNGYIGGYGKIPDFQQEWPKLGLNEKMADYVKDRMAKKTRVNC